MEMIFFLCIDNLIWNVELDRMTRLIITWLFGYLDRYTFGSSLSAATSLYIAISDLPY